MSKSSKKEKSKKKQKARRKLRFTKKNADRHDLYQRSVQAPELEVEFMVKAYKALNKKGPKTMREDFCGTALLCATWVQSNKKRTATGVDLDPDVLAWGTEHNLAPIGEPGNRIELLEQDVMKPSDGNYDVVNALNFSYWIFKTREKMRAYFEAVRSRLAEGGIFVCDVYGGWESQQPMLEPRPIKGGFTYVWDQDKFDPITHDIENHIHFEFKDGSKLKKAFSYYWRFWTMPELRELLEEAGFSNVTVHWDVAESEDDEDYQPSQNAENHAGWLAYLVAHD